ncbi:hypothetical protein CFOL_v3_15524 [Cephalotus follicularis]|uniref:HAT C-terminal dimerisation domain-containing protein n=1 Tax=Cephalotus follicularis TaxID=3775 RepID=A0A1Q3BVN2_CEPFO|nr:hypothetical protein CFOL_v3_15524 [Cephalotus follicularis]
MLQTIALRLLAQQSSSPCAERNWSTYSFAHSMKRNKMTPTRYAQRETKMWDIGGDAFDSLEDVGVLEVASL